MYTGDKVNPPPPNIGWVCHITVLFFTHSYFRKALAIPLIYLQILPVVCLSGGTYCGEASGGKQAHDSHGCRLTAQLHS